MKKINFFEHYYDVDLATGLNLHGVTPNVNVVADTELDEEVEPTSTLKFVVSKTMTDEWNRVLTEINEKEFDTSAVPVYEYELMDGILTSNFSDINAIVLGDSLLEKTRPFSIDLGNFVVCDSGVGIEFQSEGLVEFKTKLKSRLEYQEEDDKDDVNIIPVVECKKDAANGIIKKLGADSFNGQSFMVTELKFYATDKNVQRIDLLW